ncbi:MAG TPA: metalloregulator ArsR/SmtB family transcription factor [Dinghuibacter sp.]|uniref:ArsR/SmtB family transcription factor n=1 Tax=Dinghuibacter sp. TaxID=2024697 RepID=UPI002BF416DA|nr:metalloregulator ArsR/SmtB family transcription factor [Dinghuibacter sp.]HTJ11937.1 metalloregulator ArsR/SmtB family transcription factor [Dinghuibacter sp.]
MNLRRDVFQAIADPTRRAILALVAFQAMTAGAIADNFGSSRQTISKHLQILHECELLKQTQTGREVYYQVNPRKMKEVSDWLDPYRRLWDGRLAAMDKLLKNDKS